LRPFNFVTEIFSRRMLLNGEAFPLHQARPLL
jgi:hypothetical protein